MHVIQAIKSKRELVAEGGVAVLGVVAMFAMLTLFLLVAAWWVATLEIHLSGRIALAVIVGVPLILFLTISAVASWVAPHWRKLSSKKKLISVLLVAPLFTGCTLYTAAQGDFELAGFNPAYGGFWGHFVLDTNSSNGLFWEYSQHCGNNIGCYESFISQNYSGVDGQAAEDCNPLDPNPDVYPLCMTTLAPSLYFKGLAGPNTCLQFALDVNIADPFNASEAGYLWANTYNAGTLGWIEAGQGGQAEGCIAGGGV